MFAGLGVVALWASAFPAIRVAAPDLGVIGLSFIRLAVAAIALLVIATAVGCAFRRRVISAGSSRAGTFGMTAYQLLLNESELHVPAGTASIIVAAAPLVSVAVARLLFDERITPVTMVGSAVALRRSRHRVPGPSRAVTVRIGVDRHRGNGGAGHLPPASAAVADDVQRSRGRHLLDDRRNDHDAPVRLYVWSELRRFIYSGGGSPPSTSACCRPHSASYCGATSPAHLPIAASTSLLLPRATDRRAHRLAWLGEVPVAAELAGGLVVIAGVVNHLPRRQDRRRAVQCVGGAGRVMRTLPPLWNEWYETRVGTNGYPIKSPHDPGL